MVPLAGVGRSSSAVAYPFLLLVEKSSAEPKRFMLPFEEELGTHPSFENMRVHVAKNHRRPEFPINIRDNEVRREYEFVVTSFCPSLRLMIPSHHLVQRLF